MATILPPTKTDPTDALIGNVYLLESFKKPNHYVGTDDGDSYLKFLAATNDNIDNFAFKVVRGLSGETGTISFQSVKNPKQHIRHRNYFLRLQEKKGKNYEKDASFDLLDVGNLNVDYQVITSTDRFRSYWVTEFDYRLRIAEMPGGGTMFPKNMGSDAAYFKLVPHTLSTDAGKTVELTEDVFWVEIEQPSRTDILDHIAVGAPGMIWGVTYTDKIVRRSAQLGSMWEEVTPLPNGAKPKMIDCAKDGTVLCVSDEDRLHKYHHKLNTWAALNQRVKYASTGSGREIYYIDTGSKLFSRQAGGLSESWDSLNVGVSNQSGAVLKLEILSVASDGTIYFIDNTNSLFTLDIRSRHKRAVYINTSGIAEETLKVIDVSAASASQVMFIAHPENDSTDTRIYVSDGGSLFYEEGQKVLHYDGTIWRFKDFTGEIYQMDHDDSNNCYILAKEGSSFKIYKRILTK